MKPLYETDSKGTLIQGSYSELRKRVESGAGLRLGLGTKKYDELLSIDSVILTQNNIIAVQPLHTAWGIHRAEAEPYKTAILISTDRQDIFIRYNVEGKNLRYLSSSHNKDRYEYYRWFAEEDSWTEIYSSDGPDRSGHLIDGLMPTGDDIRVSFEYKGAVYMMKPYIFISPKPGSVNKKHVLPNVRTYPTVILDGDEKAVISAGKMVLAEAFIQSNSDVMILKLMRFQNTESGGTGLLNRMKRRLTSISRVRHCVEKIRIKSPVKWYARLSSKDKNQCDSLAETSAE